VWIPENRNKALQLLRISSYSKCECALQPNRGKTVAEVFMNKADNSNDQIVCPQTKVIHEDESGYIEVTKNGVIGFGSGKRPGGDGLEQGRLESGC